MKKRKTNKYIAIGVLTTIVFASAIIVYELKKPTNEEEVKNPYILIKGDGKSLYKYGLLVKKGQEVIELIDKLKLHTGNVIKIYEKVGTKWKKINEHQRIFKDTTFKVEY